MNRAKNCLFVYVLVCCLLLCPFSPVPVGRALAQEEKTEREVVSLHATSAVLLDGETGRVLYGKQEEEPRPMASTTKIMTLILALEYGNLEDYVTVSSYAAKMPQVRLGLKAGEQYKLSDLLYSMMLESHNDSAVAIAEHIGGSVENFSAMMNDKARELSLTHTYFITPNGLDAENEVGRHETTAKELALLLRYCVQFSDKREDFAAICQTRSWQFSNREGSRSFSVRNKNALLDRMDGVLAGKTGFTGNAGYCYVTAVKRGERVFYVALLACGWPNHKTYKWEDTKTLLSYAETFYGEQKVVSQEEICEYLAVQGGTGETVRAVAREDFSLLLSPWDVCEVRVNPREVLAAPVLSGEAVGSMDIYVNDVLVKSVMLYAAEDVPAADFFYYLREVLRSFLFSCAFSPKEHII